MTTPAPFPIVQRPTIPIVPVVPQPLGQRVLAPVLPIVRPTTPTVPIVRPTTPTVPVVRPMTPTVPVVRPMTPTVPVIRTPTVPIVRPTTPTVPIVRPTTPTVPIVRPTTPTVSVIRTPTVPIVRPMTPTVPIVRPTTPTVPIVRPMTPTVPVVRPTTPTVPIVRPMTPTVPVVRPTTPTVPIVRPMTPTVPVVRPTTPTVPIVRPTTPTVPVVRPTMPTVPIVRPTTPTVPIVQTPLTKGFETYPIVFSPEMIDEDTIVEYANTLNQENFAGLLEFLSDYYHNDESLVSDETYDELLDIYEAKYGAYEVVGAEPTGEKENLPHYMGSLRKYKEEKELNRWLDQHPGPYIVMDKIDGLTLNDHNIVNGKRETKLLTRGGGIRGKNVSHLLSYMKLPVSNDSIRGEVVMTKDAFARVGAGFKNARNMVSGIVGAKKQFDPNLAKELSFYAYRIMNKIGSAEDDINELQRLGFLVPNPVKAQHLSVEILTDYFNMRKEQAPYEMDGLVIYQNIAGEYPEGETPRHVVAFKTSTPTAITTVNNVIWRASKNRLLKPVVHYDTINLSGADLRKASGYNARFIVNNNIGPGAKILLTRSGDVIPKIISVIDPAPGGPAYPDPNIYGKYYWNENEVEFVVTEDSPQVIAGKLKHFIDTLGIKNMGMKRVELMVAAGIRDIFTLLTVTPQQLEGISGIGPTLSNNFYKDLHEKITNVSLATIMDASGLFEHIGERRFDDIIAVYPNLLDFVYLDPEETAEHLRQVRGIKTLADKIAATLPVFVSWLHNHPMITIARTFPTTTFPTTTFPTTTFPTTTMPTHLTLAPTQPQMTVQMPTGGGNLSGMTFVFSGFRDKDLENLIKRLGGHVTADISRNTTMLILKDLSPTSMKGKARKAEEKGIPIISKADFIERYLI